VASVNNESTSQPHVLNRPVTSKQPLPIADIPPSPAKPQILPVNPEGIPPELRSLPQWVLWRLERRKDKWTKAPYQPNGQTASSTDPRTWCIFSAAVDAFQRGGFNGIGFVFNGNGIMGVDLDSCRDPATGTLEPWAEEIVQAFQSYVEISPSGRGVHIICRGKLPPAGRRKDKIEMYDSGRFFCMTGTRLEGQS
jgi:putative DNA primase/helicase